MISSLSVASLISSALAEDLGRAGDITSQACIPAEAVGRAMLRARKAGVIAGLPLAVAAFQHMDGAADVQMLAQDGARIVAGDDLLSVTMNAQGLLSAERVALNFVQHLSGIATLTADCVQRVAHTKARVTDTRKTTPGLRALEKYAVRCGGGVNHRFGLDDAILIKDNHIALAGGVRPALERARDFAGHLVRIEIEVDTLDQLREVLNVGIADVVMLDNMPPALMREAVDLNAGRFILEASGGITPENIASVAESGVDVISLGFLTHSAPALDVGLDVIKMSN